MNAMKLRFLFDCLACSFGWLILTVLYVVALFAGKNVEWWLHVFYGISSLLMIIMWIAWKTGCDEDKRREIESKKLIFGSEKDF
jgi:hypothetical protein